MATFDDLRRFVAHDGWAAEPNLARGRARTGDHRRYRKELADGTILRTKVPHGLQDEIGAGLFRHILRDQLRVDEATFWAVVRGQGQDPPRPGVPPVDRLPAWLVERLLRTAGLGEDEIASMTREEALAAWERWQSRAQR